MIGRSRDIVCCHSAEPVSAAVAVAHGDPLLVLLAERRRPVVAGVVEVRTVTAAGGGGVTWTLSTQGYINGLAFATGLCPFSGKYGWKVGTIAGFADAIICTSTSAMHGGFVLYNGGFAAGLTALLLIPILDYYNVPLRRQDEPPALSPEEQSVILEVIGKK